MPGENDPLCSICCVGYKHAPFLEDCIRSIWDNGYKNIEIIAVDDGSEDGSAEKLAELSKISPCPMKVLSQKNTGKVGMNFNRAFAEARGEFVTFIAMDDMLMPGAIASKMAVLKQDDKCAFAISSGSVQLEEGSEPRLAISLLQSKPDARARDLLTLERIALHSFYIQEALFRSDIVRKVRGFNDNMIGDDIVLRTKLLLYLDKSPELYFRVVKGPGFIYRQHGGNVHKNKLRQIRLALEYYDKFWPREKLPQILNKWILGAIRTLPPEESRGIFAMTPRAAALRDDPTLAAELKKAEEREAVA